ncbi:MAG: FMN-binding protein [Bacteroidetes bacterium]|nr:FMN-binding protein [Bacteroidota bacterium]
MVLRQRLNQTIFILLISVLGLQAFASESDGFSQKLDKIIKKDLLLKDFKIVPLTISDEQFEKAGVNLKSNQIFRLTAEDFDGFYIIEKAMGRFHDFTYVIFLGKGLEVLLVRVLVYEEEHGVEITQKKWLQQFIGKTPTDHLIFKKNIDAISGATISGASITESIDHIFRDVKLLMEQKVF